MSKSKNSCSAMLLIGSLALAACGGGGGGAIGPATAIMSGGASNQQAASSGSSTSSNTGSSSAGTTGSSPTSSCFFTLFILCNADSTQNEELDTGSTGMVASPAPASFGSSPVPAQTATPGGSTFDGSSGSYPSGEPFPVLSTTLHFDPNGISADSTNQSVTVTKYSPLWQPGAPFEVDLSVPRFRTNVSIGLENEGESGIDDTLSYLTLGHWGTGGGPSGEYTIFLFGYETPVNALPTGGQASFSGSASGIVYVPVDGHILGNFIDFSKAALSVDFASGKVSGAFTQGVAYNPVPTATGSSPCCANGAPFPWNDVSVSASITAGTARFSGTAAVTSAPQNQFALKPSATGSISGALYGPAAQQLGAIWTLSDGTSSAIGRVVAVQH